MVERAPTRHPDRTDAPSPISTSAPMKALAPTVAPAETWAKSSTTVSWSTEDRVLSSTPRPMIAPGVTTTPAEIIAPVPIVALGAIELQG